MLKSNKIKEEKKNCEGCAHFRYEAAWGHGWCYAEGQFSGKLRGNGPSCNLNTTIKK